MTRQQPVSSASDDEEVKRWNSACRATVLAAAASVTEQITLSSAVTVLSTEDPVRVYTSSSRRWSGRFRPPFADAHVYPRPYGRRLRISIGTGGHPESSVRGGLLGLPVVYAVIGGEPERFAPLVGLYRRAGEAGRHSPGSTRGTPARCSPAAPTKWPTG